MKKVITVFSLLCLFTLQANGQEGIPQLHGILRGKYEYEPDLDASRFEVRNARLSIESHLPTFPDKGGVKLQPAYKLEVDLCDESQIKMKDAWVRLALPLLGEDEGGMFRATIGQQRMPFSIDAHRNPSAQYFANREASYTSLDFGAYYESSGFHIEAEYLRKFYAHDAFDDCNAIDAMVIYKMTIKEGYLNGVSYLLRYDYMDNHSDGKKGWATSNSPKGEKRLVQSDAERHRLTAGITFHVANKLFPTDSRLNYEKYWYPNHDVPKESEQDKLVAELMIRF